MAEYLPQEAIGEGDLNAHGNGLSGNLNNPIVAVEKENKSEQTRCRCRRVSQA